MQKPCGYQVLFTEEAKNAYSRIRSLGDLKEVNDVLRVLDTVPGIGREYDPVYAAARPPFAVMVAYAGHFGIYYVVSEEQHEVQVYFIEDQRRDPLNRFGSH